MTAAIPWERHFAATLWERHFAATLWERHPAAMRCCTSRLKAAPTGLGMGASV